ncbi:MAG TPA: methyltransferase domain-containing protein [Stenomitos sp.]
MTTPNLETAVTERYGELAQSSCCLSCGGAIDLATPKPGEVGLDLGSGRGLDVLRMAEAVGPKGLAFGVDLTQAMIDRAEKNAKKLGISNVRFLKSDLADIDLPSDFVDLVISNCTINHAPDKAAVWREIFRVLKPGGRFVVSDIYALSDVPEEYSTDPEAIAECWAGAVTREVYLADVADAGFTEVRILEESAPYQKGHITVASLSVAGIKLSRCCS